MKIFVKLLIKNKITRSRSIKEYEIREYLNNNAYNSHPMVKLISRLNRFPLGFGGSIYQKFYWEK